MKSASQWIGWGMLGFILLLIVLSYVARAPGPTGVGGSRQSRILAEISQLDSAFAAYRQRYGEYPPSDMSDVTNPSGPVAKHLKKLFPECKLLKASEKDSLGELDAIAILQNGDKPLSPAQAMVFWLSGFSDDAARPICGRLPQDRNGKIDMASFNWALNSPRPFYAFDGGRLIVNGATGSHVPAYVPSGYQAPYVYFAAQNYVAHWQANCQFPNAAGPPGSAWNGQGGNGNVRPYLEDNSNPRAYLILGFKNPQSYQIISAGVDDDYGGSFEGDPAKTGATFSSGIGGHATFNNFSKPFYPYTSGDKDNLTNFSGKNLEDSMPQ